MKDMMLNEDNKSILDLVNYIDSKIVALRKDNKFSKNVMDSLSNLYNLTVGEWMSKNYISNIEPSSSEEEEIVNKLLEIIDFLNKLEPL
jgi:hypothetical protein